MSDTGTVWPIAGQTRQQARITNRFGAPQVRSAGWKGGLPPTNNGVDIAAGAGTGVVAPASGRVVEVRRNATDNSGWGNSIVIEDAQGRRHRLSHLMDEPSLRVGDTVRAGQAVGRVGQTGNATGPHLDYELRVNGQPTDALGLAFGAGAPITEAPRAGAAPMAETQESPQIAQWQEQRAEARRQEATWQATLLTAEENLAQLNAADTSLMSMDQMEQVKALRADLEQRRQRAQAELTRHRTAADKLEQQIAAAQEKATADAEKAAAKAAEPPPMRDFGPGVGDRQWNAKTQQWEAVPGIPAQAAAEAAAQRPQTFQGTDGLQYEVTGGAGNLTARLIPGQPGATGKPASFSVQQAPDGSVWVFDPATGKLGEQLFPAKPTEPARYANDGRIIGLDPASGEVKYTVDTRTEEARTLAQLEAQAKAEAIRIGNGIRQELDAALALPEGPERQQAIEQVSRKYAMLEGPSGARALLQMGQQEADRKTRAANQLSEQTGIQYDPDTMQPKVDPLTGEMMKTVAQVERERAAEAQKASAALAERAQTERERAADVSAQQQQQINLIAQQRADEEGRSAIERELTSRQNARTTSLAEGRLAAGIGTGREVGTPMTMAAQLASQSGGLGRDAVINLGRQMGVDSTTLNAVLSGFDEFQGQQQRLQSQLQEVRRAPTLGALPPTARTPASTTAPAGPPAPGGAPAATAAPPALPAPQMFGTIGPNAYNWTPQPPGGPVAEAASLVPPPGLPPMGEPETVMLPSAPPPSSVPSTIEELLLSLDMMPMSGAR